jgi:predicted DNA-binding transcriptional regulator AlpA
VSDDVIAAGRAQAHRPIAWKIPALARELSVSKTLLYQLCAKGWPDGPRTRHLGRAIRVLDVDLEEWLRLESGDSQTDGLRVVSRTRTAS